MKTSTLLAAVASLSAVVLAENAPVTQNNPIMTDIQATLQSSKNIQGSITGVSENGTGVYFNVNFYDFPSTGGPFSYYIANAAVPSSNACASLTTLFNPYSASSTCQASSPATCALGALSAKHGAITGATADSSFQKFYLDLYLSTSPGSEAYFGGRSIVVADKNGTPVNCATFPGMASSSSSSSASGMATATSSMSSAGSSSAASASSASAAATSTAAAVANQVALDSGMALVAAIAMLVV